MENNSVVKKKKRKYPIVITVEDVKALLDSKAHFFWREWCLEQVKGRKKAYWHTYLEFRKMRDIISKKNRDMVDAMEEKNDLHIR